MRIFRSLQDDSVSMFANRDADSVLTSTSVGSSKWSMNFEFDGELFSTQLYRAWFRKLASSSRSFRRQRDAGIERQLEHQRPPVLSDAATASAAAETSSTVVSSTQESSTRDGDDGVGIKMQPLGQSQGHSQRMTGALVGLNDLKRTRKTKSPQNIIERHLRQQKRLAKHQTRALLLGSESRQAVMEAMIHLCTNDDLIEFRTHVHEFLIDCAKCLAEHVQALETTPPTEEALELAKRITDYCPKWEETIYHVPGLAESLIAFVESEFVTNLLTHGSDLGLPTNAK